MVASYFLATIRDAGSPIGGPGQSIPDISQMTNQSDFRYLERDIATMWWTASSTGITNFR
jgi:hypothetical protein